MKTKTLLAHRALILLPALLAMLALSNLTHAATPEPEPEPGTYCEMDPGTLSLVAEELSVTLKMVLHSQSLQGKDRQSEKFSELLASNVSLQLAAGRGNGHLMALIDTIIAARRNEDYTQQLTWFPLLQTAMLDLPDNPRTRLASYSIGRAHSIMEEDGKDDPMQQLREARQMLACDALDEPLQNALQAQRILARQFSRNKAVAAKDYSRLIDSLRKALLYVLQNNQAP